MIVVYCVLISREKSKVTPLEYQQWFRSKMPWHERGRILLSRITQVDQFDYSHTLPLPVSQNFYSLLLWFCLTGKRRASSFLYLLHHLQFWDTMKILIGTTPLYGISCSHGIRVYAECSSADSHREAHSNCLNRGSTHDHDTMPAQVITES